MLDDAQLMQYSRHLLLPEVDIAGQLAWMNASVLIVGLGGLGSPVALYLAAAGVGHLLLVDDDEVELSNLQRQIIHSQAELGQPKVDSARRQLARLNPQTRVETLAARLADQALHDAVAGVDLVVDCSDNFATRHALNRACFRSGVPLVSGAAIRFEGQISVFDPSNAASPCYACLYPEGAEVAENCSTSGVLGPVVGMVGTVQATEALKLLASLGRSLVGRLLLLDALQMEWRSLTLHRDPSCPVCAELRETVDE